MKDDQPLCEWIVHRACERGIAGATVIRGNGGYYLNDPVKSPEIISMQVMRPVIIEIVDQPERNIRESAVSMCLRRIIDEMLTVIGGVL